LACIVAADQRFAKFGRGHLSGILADTGLAVDRQVSIGSRLFERIRIAPKEERRAT
jgi:hypothetical protein